ncbi:hypothetical protein CY34DRAFT_111127 [Suillus luteus UH-Slu-Lm8-n1]|uniref:Uncharacterized protein n=1 Tax=Suillus luteus UH-Slu-Lm8-n1 TaxID=930992 RepID=A0A0C9Z3W3_9AGAM|nr:hypothetical protein CY34DRAFT_111127 [Suillus luteus UH-Slu-Lm8-n1]
MITPISQERRRQSPFTAVSPHTRHKVETGFIKHDDLEQGNLQRPSIETVIQILRTDTSRAVKTLPGPSLSVPLKTSKSLGFVANHVKLYGSDGRIQMFVVPFTCVRSICFKTLSSSTLLIASHFSSLIYHNSHKTVKFRRKKIRAATSNQNELLLQVSKFQRDLRITTHVLYFQLT